MEQSRKSLKNKSFTDNLFGFDTETTGLDKFPDTRPTGIAFLKYDSDFKNKLNLNISVRLPFSKFPSPEALILQNKFYNEINSKKNFEFYDAMAKVKNFIDTVLFGKTICGHNINRFDIKQLNIWLNKSLYDPYPFQKKFGNVVIDTLAVARFLKAIGNDHFNFPNFSLETLMKSFLGEIYKQSHGAAGDVIDVFKFLTLANKRLQTMTGKNLIEILRWFNSEGNRTGVFNSSLILKTSNMGKFEPIIPLSNCTNWKDYKIVLPFNKDKIDWTINTPEAVATHIKKTAKPNSISIKKEFVYPVISEDTMSDIGKRTLEKFPVSEEFIFSVINSLREDQEFIKQCQIKVNENRRESKKPVLKYDGHYRDGHGFFGKDSNRMRFFHEAKPEKKKEFCKAFEHEGIRKNAELYLFNKHPEVLSQSEWNDMFDMLYNEFFDSNNTSCVTYTSCHEEFEEIKKDVKNGKKNLSDKQRDILDDYKVRLEAFKNRPKSFWDHRHGY